MATTAPDSSVPFDPIAFLRDLIQAPSPDPPGDEQQVAGIVERQLLALGFEVEAEEFAPRRHNVLGRLRGSGERAGLVFSAHMDTLPPGSGEWRHGPYSGQLREGRIWGRGACDMKSGLAAMVAAASALARRVASGDLHLHGDLVLAFTGGESSSCLGARRLLQTGALAGCGGLLVSEPSSLDVVVAESGALWLRATARGEAGHASGGSGRNAILAMLAFLQRLPEAVPAGEHPLLGKASASVGTIDGGTAINLMPDRCSADIDVRLLPAHDADAVQARCQALAGEHIVIERLDYKPAVASEAADPFVALCLDEASRQRNCSLEPRGASYFSDACVLAPGFGLPMVIIGPGALGGSGALDESCAVDDVHMAARIFECIAARYLG